ncbi:MAG TPA: CPXCG motif-containing cysteine-rich protein [Longimicrobium sp.]|nr:CPXCG motif-containing cysteine-rich protein [Longimicrobium sp.]
MIYISVPPDDDTLDEDFPLGDGTADTTAESQCPYCGETVVLGLDPGGGAHQEYVEDCPVCCNPWSVRLEYDADGTAWVTLDQTE